MDQKFETKLVFEILRSELLAKIQRCIRRRIGEFMVIREFENDGALVRVFANRGVPIVFEIAETQNGKLSLHRERPAFFWESHWEEFFGAWVEADENAAGGAEYQDGLMWNHVLPSDIAFNVCGVEWGGRWRNPDRIPVINHFVTFRPEINRSWLGQLEIDVVKMKTQIFYRAGFPYPLGGAVITSEELKYLNAYNMMTGMGDTDRRNTIVAECGFIHDPSIQLREFFENSDTVAFNAQA